MRFTGFERNTQGLSLAQQMLLAYHLIDASGTPALGQRDIS
jgi:hypothetical protein